MNFTEKCLGGEVPFNPKTDVADYGNFKEGFCSMKLIQKSNFRVQDMFLAVQDSSIGDLVTHSVSESVSQ